MIIRNQRLPIGYRELEYIESTGTQHFSTGVEFNMESGSVDIEFQASTTSQNGMILANSSSNYWWLYYYNSGNGIYIYLSGNSQGQQNLNRIPLDTDKHHVQYKNKTFFIDNIQKGTATGTLGTTSSLYMFSYGGAYYYQGKIFSCKISNGNGNGLVRNFIPAERLSDNKPGMYDVVNNQFYTNAGTGEFLVGPYNDSYDISLYSNNSIKKCGAALSLYQAKIVLDTVDSTQKLATIKLVKAYTGLALKASKDLVDAVLAGTPQVLKELYSAENNYCNCDSAFTELQVQTVNFSNVNATISLQHS